MDVDAVQQRAGNSFLVAQHRAGRTGARLFRIAMKAALARVHCRHQLEVGREGERALRTRDSDNFVFQRLAQHLQHALAELRQLIQKKHAAMRKRDLARARPIAAAHQPGVRDGVMGRTKRAQAHNRRIVLQHVGDGIHARYIECLFKAERRQDGRQCARKQGLAGPRRAAQQHIVSAGSCHLQRALHMLLAAHLCKVRQVGRQLFIVSGWRS